MKSGEECGARHRAGMKSFELASLFGRITPDGRGGRVVVARTDA